MDLFWRENLICPTEQEYIDMVNNSEDHNDPQSTQPLKGSVSLFFLFDAETGGLFRIAIKLMMAASTEDPPRSAANQHLLICETS